METLKEFVKAVIMNAKNVKKQHLDVQNVKKTKIINCFTIINVYKYVLPNGMKNMIYKKDIIVYLIVNQGILNMKIQHIESVNNVM